MEGAGEATVVTFHRFAGDTGYLKKGDLRALVEKDPLGFWRIKQTLWLWTKSRRTWISAEKAQGLQSFCSAGAGLSTACGDAFAVHRKAQGEGGRLGTQYRG